MGRGPEDHEFLGVLPDVQGPYAAAKPDLKEDAEKRCRCPSSQSTAKVNVR
jgi:hypothetical protein